MAADKQLVRYCRRCGWLIEVWNDRDGWHVMRRPGRDESAAIFDRTFDSPVQAMDAGWLGHQHGGA